jgi:hypothetical protein
MSNREVFSSTETAYDLGYKRGKDERFHVVYYDINDLNMAELEHMYALQSENIDNLIYLPKGSSLKTFTIEQLKQVRDQFVDYVNSLIGDKLHEDLEG